MSFPLWKPLSPAPPVPLLSRCPPTPLHHSQTHCQSLLLKVWLFHRSSPRLHGGSVVSESLYGTLQWIWAQFPFIKGGKPEHHPTGLHGCTDTYKCTAVTPKTSPRSSKVGWWTGSTLQLSAPPYIPATGTSISLSDVSILKGRILSPSFPFRGLSPEPHHPSPISIVLIFCLDLIQ